MGMEGSGLSVADAIALSDKNEGNWGGSGTWIWVFFLFFLLAWGGNGFGFGNNAAGQYATQADIQRGFDTNTIVNKLDGLNNGICSLGYENSQLANQTQSQIANLGYQTQNCCCEVNRNIDAVRAENYRNTCEITNAVHSEGEQTRALITANTMQELRDQLQAAQLQLGNVAQTQTLINALRPFPTPAYITCSPYTANNGYGACSCGGCNC